MSTSISTSCLSFQSPLPMGLEGLEISEIEAGGDGVAGEADVVETADVCAALGVACCPT